MRRLNGHTNATEGRGEEPLEGKPTTDTNSEEEEIYESSEKWGNEGVYVCRKMSGCLDGTGANGWSRLKKRMRVES